MKRCLLGCGNVVHDIDEHIKFMHPDADYPELPESHWSNPTWDATEWQAASSKQMRFIEDNFQPITL